MADRELLELAARAAGIAVFEWSAYYDGIPFGFVKGPKIKEHWSPFTDGAHALDLAVRLRLLIGIHQDESWAQSYGTSDGWITIKEKHGDPNVATYRAIVKCAAEIARAQAA